MMIGAGVTKVWVPNPCDAFGESRSLESLSKGKKARQKMEEEERQERRLAEQARYGNV
jgi:PHS family inorganic phosphate transporter-like MFS transporter